MTSSTAVRDLRRRLRADEGSGETKVNRRQAVFASPLNVNWTGRTCDILLGGSAIVIPAVHFLDNVYPVSDETCWVDFTGANPVIVATQKADVRTSWTPTVVGFPAGTKVGKYARFGNLCIASFQYNFTGGAATNSAMTFTLPFTAANDGVTVVGAGWILDNGVRHYLVNGYVSPNTSTVNLVQTEAASNGALTDQSPFAIGAGDVLALTITYWTA